MLWLGRARKYAMWMSPPCTRERTRTALTLLVIRRSSRNPLTNPWGRILVSPRWTFFQPLACSTPSCPCAVVTNSPFLCVAPVSRRSRPNPCCIALTTAIIRTWIGCYAVLGAPPSWSKPWKRGTPRSRSTKSGIFPPSYAGQVLLLITSTHG